MSTPEQTNPAAETVSIDAWPINGKAEDYNPLLEAIDERNIVLLGEGSHGTEEFYQERAKISQRLIIEKGFRAIAIEGDWSAVSWVNRYVQTGQGDSEQALSRFKRFPLWMWRNKEFLAFIEWLKDFNQDREDKVAVYGLDIYGLHQAIGDTVAYLQTIDAEAAKSAERDYGCFGKGREEDYGRAIHLGESESCRREAVNQLNAIRSNNQGNEEHFIAEGNARLIVNAEEYYRTLFRDPDHSWNLRERHMAETFDYILAHVDSNLGQWGKVIIWAHNSHVSDARATSVSQYGQLTLGQILRQRHRDDVFLTGFTTYSGTVTAASNWGEVGEIYQIEPGHFDSIERLFHESSLDNFLLIQNNDNRSSHYLQETFSQRAIGVVYRPQTERESHYLAVVPARAFDAFVHLDRTKAIEPLATPDNWTERGIPDTYPSAV